MKYPILVLATLLLFSLPGLATAQTPPCKANYDSAISAIDNAAIGVGDKSKLRAHVNNAWRKFSSGKQQSLNHALKDLDQALKLLASNATSHVPPQTRASLTEANESMRTCLATSAPSETAILKVRTFLPSDVSPDGISGPAPAGVIIFVDNVEFGITNASGEITLRVPARTLEIEARLYPSSSGVTQVTLSPKETKRVDIILQDGKELSEDATLTVDQPVEGVLDRNFTALSLRFIKDDGSTVVLKQIDLVAVVNVAGAASRFATGMFTLQPNGTLVLNNVAGFRSLLVSGPGKILLNAHGEDANGRVYDQTVEFFIGAAKVVGHLAAPPSNPALNTSGIIVTGKILNTPLVFNVVSDAGGNFEFPLLPFGNFELFSETLQNGSFYYGQGFVVLAANKLVNLNMLATIDLENGIVPFTATTLFEITAQTANGLNPANLPERKVSAASPLVAFATNDLANVSVNVASAITETPVTRTVTLSIPQGTQTVHLTYFVQSDEYPFFVLAQSSFNDIWNISVPGGTAGQQLFNLTRDINSQVTVPPVWQSNGTTGVISQSIDVAALAANGPTSLVLFATAMNVADSAGTTRVTALLGDDASIRMNTATPDSSLPLNFHSIPRPGQLNTFDRFFTLNVSKPKGSTVTKVVATLLGPGPQMIVVDEAPGNGSVQVIDDNTVRVRVSMKAIASTVASQPPPVHQLKYRFKLVVNVDGTEGSDEKDSGDRLGLWRMPDGFARYSIRDEGGDDWCSQGTYSWLISNAARLTKINDISGEHGRNIGHQSHKHGTDIDMFHFFTFPGAVSGGDNYTKLVSDVLLAIKTGSPNPVVAAQAQAAKGRVISWVNSTHAGLDALAADNMVNELRYALGAATTGLSVGWARDLLKSGKTTVNGQPLDLGTGVWSNSKYIPLNDHNDHVHITLSRVFFDDGD